MLRAAVIGQARSSFDFRWMMDNEKILLCDFSKGAIGEDNAQLLGSLVVIKENWRRFPGMMCRRMIACRTSSAPKRPRFHRRLPVHFPGGAEVPLDLCSPRRALSNSPGSGVRPLHQLRDLDPSA